MNEMLKKGLIFGIIYLVLLLCAFMMCYRMERLDNSKVEKTSSNVFSSKINNNR